MKLLKTDLIPSSFNYQKYLNDSKLNKLLKNEYVPDDPSKKIIFPKNFAVDPNNKIPFPAEYDDLCRLHYITQSRKVTTILEFGVGKSTIILGDALNKNKKNYYEYSSKNLRRGNLYEAHSVDNNEEWLEVSRKNIPEELLSKSIIHLNFSNVFTSTFNGRICTFYDKLPNISPDLIYLDGPDQYSPKGDVRGLSTSGLDRMPMTADILSFEHFLQPGTLIIVDGRTANARFLKSNLQRNWAYLHEENWDQHFFELVEKPLGIYNKRMIDHCLGESFYEKLRKSGQ